MAAAAGGHKAEEAENKTMEAATWGTVAEAVTVAQHNAPHGPTNATHASLP